MEQLLKPHHHHYLLGAVVAVSATAILIAGGPYLLAQSDPSQTSADTALTAPAPASVVPQTTPTPIEPVDTTQPPQPLPDFPPIPPEILKALPPEILKQLQGGALPPKMPFDQDTVLGDPGNGGKERPISPSELQRAVRELTQLRRELKKFAQALAATGNASDEQKQVAELGGKLERLAQTLQPGAKVDAEAVHEALDEMRNSDLHETVAQLRAKVELPKRLKKLEQELKRIQMLGTQPSFQKLGLDLTKLTARLEQIRLGYNTALTELKAGDFEAAMDTLRNLELDGHPGDAVEVVYRLRDLQRFLKPVKDTEVLAEANAIVQPITEAFNAGEFDQAKELMAEAFPQLTKLAQVAQRLERGRTGNRTDMMEKLGALEEKLKQKYELLGEREAGELKPKLIPQPKPPVQQPTEPSTTTPTAE